MWLVVVVAGVICFGLTAANLYAAADDTVVTVTVTPIDLLESPATLGLTLNATAYAAAYTTVTDATGSFKIQHNTQESKKVTVTLVKDAANTDTQNITLTVAITDGAGVLTLVNAGTTSTVGQIAWTGIASGTYDKLITWTAAATLAGTKVPSTGKNYIWTVTFTSAAV